MKFKNFNIEDVFGPNDIEESKACIGKKGYFANNVELFDYYIKDKTNIDTLYSIDKDNVLHRFVGGRSFDYCGHYTFFLPVDKVKKTKPAKIKII